MTGTVDIHELKRLAEAATQGEWSINQDGDIEAKSIFEADGYRHEQVEYVAHAMCSQNVGWIEWASDANAAYIAAASPDTILALIEVAEAAKGMLAHACIADADPCDVDEEDRALERRLRTALEGVKK